MLAAGTMITDKVRLARPLSEGAMGTLWIADHLGFNAPVAVKFILPEQAESNPQAQLRFDQEATALGQIKSEHVVQIFDRSEMPDGTPFIVMELLEGESPVDRLERTGPMSLPDVGRLIRQIAEALHEVHRRGIVHRDLKAENIFLSGAPDSPFVKILDFGLAKLPVANPHANKLTGPGVLIGTAEYMCPTQTFSALAVDHLTDLWALGVLAYVAITMELPFKGETNREIFAAIRGSKYVAPSLLRNGVGPEIDAWFARAFNTEADARFQSAMAAADGLNEAIMSQTLSEAAALSGLPPDTRTLSTRPPSSSRALAIALVFAVVVIAVLLGLLLLR